MGAGLVAGAGLLTGAINPCGRKKRQANFGVKNYYIKLKTNVTSLKMRDYPSLFRGFLSDSSSPYLSFL